MRPVVVNCYTLFTSLMHCSRLMSNNKDLLTYCSNWLRASVHCTVQICYKSYHVLESAPRQLLNSSSSIVSEFTVYYVSSLSKLQKCNSVTLAACFISSWSDLISLIPCATLFTSGCTYHVKTSIKRNNEGYYSVLVLNTEIRFISWTINFALSFYFQFFFTVITLIDTTPSHTTCSLADVLTNGRTSLWAEL